MESKLYAVSISGQGQAGGGLPSDLLAKIRSVKSEGGNAALRGLAEGVTRVAEVNSGVLEDIRGMLGREEQGDKSYQAHFGAASWSRPASQSAAAKYHADLDHHSKNMETAKANLTLTLTSILTLTLTLTLILTLPQGC